MIDPRSNISELSIIDGIIKGNKNVIDSLYLENYPVIRHYIEKNNGNEHHAKDIYQDAFILVIRNIKNGTFKGDSAIKTYLYAISRRLWLKELGKTKARGKKLHDLQIKPSTDDDNHEEWEERDKKIQLMGASLQQLGEPCSTILNDFYINNMSMEEIKNKMGYTSAGNAKNQKYKCLQRLRKIFFK